MLDRAISGPSTLLAWSPDGRILASANGKGIVRLWDPANGEPGLVLNGQAKLVGDSLNLAFRPDGHRVGEIVGNGLFLRDAAAGRAGAVIQDKDIISFAFHPDGKRLATAGGSALDIRESETGDRPPTLLRKSVIASPAFNAKGRLASGGDDGTIPRRDRSTGKADFRSPSRNGRPGSLAFVSDDRLASCGNDGTVRLWDLAAKRPPWVGLPVGSDRAERITASGQLFVGDPADEGAFVSLVQASVKGPVELLSPAAFRERLGKELASRRPIGGGPSASRVLPARLGLASAAHRLDAGPADPGWSWRASRCTITHVDPLDRNPGRGARPARVASHFESAAPARARSGPPGGWPMSLVNPPRVPPDLDAIVYPSSDGQPMGETGIHVLAIIRLFLALHAALPEADFIAADMFWYWQQGHPESVVAPDVMVVRGKGRALRTSFFTWREDGAVPCVVFEMASEGTWREDLGRKRALYERLGVAEYLLFDPEWAYLPSKVMGYRLVDGRYEAIEPDREGRVAIAGLGLLMGADGLMPRLYEAATGAAVATPGERAEQERERAEHADQRAEQERARAEQERARADALGAEVERLKALLDQTRGAADGGPSA